MPLLKSKAASTENAALGTIGKAVEAPKTDAPMPEQTVHVASVKKAVAQKAASSKEEYWANKEANDHAKDIRISRSGLFQACLQSVGLLQLNTGNTFDDYMKLVEQATERGLAFVNKV